jgi:L-aspartate oxidase
MPWEKPVAQEFRGRIVWPVILLLECIVFGPTREAQPNPIVNEPLKLKESATMADLGDWPSQQAKIEQLRQELPRLVWQSAGICRDKPT